MSDFVNILWAIFAGIALLGIIWSGGTTLRMVLHKRKLEGDAFASEIHTWNPEALLSTMSGSPEDVKRPTREDRLKWGTDAWKKDASEGHDKEV